MAILQTEYQKIYEAVRNAIISGEYSPGEKLPQRKLAERFNGTTITIREVLRTLEKDKLIVMIPKWGAIVEEITEEKIYGKYAVREALEAMAAKLACQKIDNEEKKKLIKLAKRSDKDLLSDNLSPLEKANLHYTLHEEIVNTTGCNELIEAINQENLYLILLQNAYHINWKSNKPNWHTLLVKAIISGDPDFAEKTMKEHVRVGYRMEIEAFRNGKKNVTGLPGR